MKKNFLEIIHDIRYLIIVIVILASLIALWSCFNAERYFLGAFGIFTLGYFLNELFTGVKFKTENNLALVCWGNTILERMYKPGDWLILLPGYDLIQEKGNFTLSTLEASFTIEKKVLQFKSEETSGDDKPKKKSGTVDAGNIKLSFLLKRDVKSIYRFLMITPSNWESEIKENFSGDFEQSFKNRISNINDAIGYKDFKFFKSLKAFYWQIDPKDRTKIKERDNKDLTTVNFKEKEASIDVLDIEEITELITSVDNMLEFGLIPVRLTVGSYTYDDKTSGAQGGITEQEYENTRKTLKTTNTLDRQKSYEAHFEGQGYNKKEATQEAIRMILAEDGTRTEIGGDKDVKVMIPGPQNTAGKKKS